MPEGTVAVPDGAEDLADAEALAVVPELAVATGIAVAAAGNLGVVLADGLDDDMAGTGPVRTPDTGPAGVARALTIGVGVARACVVGVANSGPVGVGVANSRLVGVASGAADLAADLDRVLVVAVGVPSRARDPRPDDLCVPVLANVTEAPAV